MIISWFSITEYNGIFSMDSTDLRRRLFDEELTLIKSSACPEHQVVPISRDHFQPIDDFMPHIQ